MNRSVELRVAQLLSFPRNRSSCKKMLSDRDVRSKNVIIHGFEDSDKKELKEELETF